MVSEAEELNFLFYLILINLNLDSLMWLVAIITDSKALELNTQMASQK